MSTRFVNCWAAAGTLAAALLCQFGCSSTRPHIVPVQDGARGPDSPSALDPRLSAAKQALDRKEYPLALELIGKSILERAPKTHALRLRSDVFRATDYLDLEIETLREWSAESPRDLEPLLRLFYIYIDLGWRRDAGKVSARAVKIDPKHPEANVARAVFHYRSADPLLGVSYIDNALRAKPGDAAAANLKASILLKSLRYAQSEQAAREALALDPNSVPNRLVLSHALTRQGKLEDAGNILAEALRMDPLNPEALFESGANAQKRGAILPATAFFEKVAAIDVRFGNVAYRLGSLYLKQGRTAEGRKLTDMFRKMDASTSAYETALSRVYARPLDSDLHYQLARLHLEADELPQTIVELRRALELNGKHPQAKRDLIHALMRHGRITEARRLAESDRRAGG